jgi:hypothetical protein
VEGNPEAQAELASLGIRQVPAVSIGTRAVHGWNPAGYAELLGVPYGPAKVLPPAELGARLDDLLACGQRLAGRIPAEHMGWKMPTRDRSLGDLAFHLFRVGLTFADAMDGDGLAEGWFREKIPLDLTDGAAVARYGALVRGRLQGWFEGAGPSEFARDVKTYYGPQPAHDFLERSTWHVAQHLRQLHHLLTELGIDPGEPMPLALFADLPLPESLW